MGASTDSWLRRFARKGYAEAEPIGDGMEGAVYKLNKELVAKVWTRKESAQLEVMGAFYEELAESGLGYATPRFLDVWEFAGSHITVEPHLRGTPLDTHFPSAGPPHPKTVGCVLEVLEGLHSIGDLPAARKLPVLEESEALWTGARTWQDALQGLIDRRLAQFGDQLQAEVPDFEQIEDRLRSLIAGLEYSRLGVVHGDLIPANILVDEGARPIAVLDFGFFTTIADPAFDLAVTASIFDMYSPRARATEAFIDRAMAERFEIPPDRLALYRAVYAIVSANAYDPTGQDGHFRWCVEILRREDVASLLEANRNGR